MGGVRFGITILLSLAPLVLASGCDAFASRGDGTATMEDPGAVPVAGPMPSSNPTGVAVAPPGPTPLPSPTMDMGIPTDERAVQSPERPALPISGGTLLLDASGELAIAADPERDRISVVHVFFEERLHTLELEPGDQPTRLVEDGDGRVHVVLRGSDQIAAFDPREGVLLDRREVCTAPRGITHDPQGDLVHVVCATGGLWSLPAAGGEPVRTLQLEPDLRDVLVHGERMWVTRFRSAELLELDASGEVIGRQRPNGIHSGRGIRATEVQRPRFEPNGAFRTVVDEGGAVMMLHQRALVAPIKIDPNMPASLNGYYAGTCGGIVESAVTIFHPDGQRSVSGSLAGALAVDVAATRVVDPQQLQLDGPDLPPVDQAVVAFAGQPDPDAPAVSRVFPASAPILPHGSVQQALLNDATVTADEQPDRTCQLGTSTPTRGQSVAVAARADGAVVVALSREPAQLEIIRKPGGSTESVIDLGGPSVRDTGHEMFHRSPGGGVTCASCHLEGGDDGHVWSFDPLGPRRTQSANVGLAGTEPFHWEGDMPDLEALLEEVMVVRMGGVHQSPQRIEALGEFMFALTPPPPLRSADDAAVLRGRELFESEAVGCAGCHSGAALTDNGSYDVGTGEPLQVPSLRGVGYRAPLIHDGCASTLRERFDPGCGGGDEHGSTSQLSEAQLDDLIAYLESL